MVKMAKSFLRVDKRRALKDGTYPVQVAIGYGTDMYIPTGITVRDGEWDERARLYIGPNAKRVNSLLTTNLVRISNRVLYLRDRGLFQRLSREQLKRALLDVDLTDEEILADESKTLGAMFDRVIATKSKRNGEIFTQTLQKIKAFCNPYDVTFEQITRMWLLEFSASMEGLSVNSKAIHLRNLRNVINFALDEGITQNYPFRSFKIQTEETEMRVLPIDTLRYYRTASLNKYDAEHRDMFMLTFYLIGINIVDLSKLTPESVVNGRIEYRRSKTGKLYSIKIEPEAQDILDRYKGEQHLLRCFDRYANYKDYAQHMNNAMRRIGPIKTYKNGKPVLTGNGLTIMQPLNDKVTSYWARYSWATYAAELDIPKDTISEALGHEYGSRITGVYIKYSRDKIDAANRQVIDYLIG